MPGQPGTMMNDESKDSVRFSIFFERFDTKGRTCYIYVLYKRPERC